jgi:hypothetical protein
MQTQCVYAVLRDDLSHSFEIFILGRFRLGNGLLAVLEMEHSTVCAAP